MQVSDRPLRKVTLNLYEEDVAWLQDVYGYGYSEKIRNAIREFVRKKKDASYA